MYFLSCSEQVPPAEPIEGDGTTVNCSDYVPKAAFTPDAASNPNHPLKGHR